MNPYEIQDEVTREDFIALHERMLILSKAITNGDPNIIGQRSSEVGLTIIELPCKINLDPEIGREIGGDSLVNLLKSIIDSSTPCSSENSTPVSTTTISEEEQAYVEWIDGVAREMSDSETRFMGLMEDLTNDQGLATDTDWQLSLALELTRWQSLYEEAQLKAPPPSLEEVHVLIVKGLEEFNTFVTLFMDPPDEGDPAAINDHLRTGRELISQGSALYQQWRDEHDQ
jgi:hypothetical protein